MNSAPRIASSVALLVGLATVLAAGVAPKQEASTPPPASGTISSLTFSFVPGRMVGSLQFAVTLKRDGTATYATKQSTGAGTYKATGLQAEFAEAIKKVDACGYWKLPSHYGRSDSVFAYGVVSVATNASRKTIIDAGAQKQHTGAAAPDGLKQVERTLAQLIQSAHWKKISDKASFTTYSPKTDGEG